MSISGKRLKGLIIIAATACCLLLAGAGDAAAQVKKLNFKKLPATGYADRYRPLDWVATKDTLSVLIGGDYLDRTVAKERVAVGTQKLKPNGKISAFKSGIEVKGKPLVAAAWPQGGKKGLVFIAAEAPLSSTYLYEDEIYAAQMTAKGAIKNARVIFRLPYESGGLYYFHSLIAAHSGDRAALAFSYYRTISGDYQWMKTIFIEVSTSGSVVGGPVEIVRSGNGSAPALQPLALYPTDGGWLVALRYRPDGLNVSSAAEYKEELHTCFISAGGGSPASTATARRIEAYQGNGYVWYTGATYLQEFGKNRVPGLFFQRKISEPDATAKRVPPYQTKAAIAGLKADGTFISGPTGFTVPKWEKETYVYSLSGPNTLLSDEEFSNVLRGSGYTYLVAQVRHGKHSTWPNGGSEGEPEQQYNLYEINGRDGGATKLAMANFKWQDYYQGRNNTRFGLFKIQKFGSKTGVLIHVTYGAGEDLLYALY